jgi:hypothetical protein
VSIGLLLPALGLVSCVGACVGTSHSNDAAFEQIQPGDAESVVAARFRARPSVREQRGILFARYATVPCSGRCAERIWYENRFSLDTEAWSFELDGDGRVIEKARWESP